MVKSNKVLVTGISGQDGSLLATKLIATGTEVFGGFRRTNQNLWRIQELGILDQINLVNYDATDPATIDFLVSSHSFDAIFHFAGSSFTVDSLEYPQNTLLTNINGTVSLLEAVRKFSPETKIFIAGSSEIFFLDKNKSINVINEDTRRLPRNPYGVSHLAISSLVDIYQRIHNLQITLGLFFNHESCYRSLQFVSRKISHGISGVKLNNVAPLKLGNFSSRRDWGSAEDYMDGAIKLINENIFGEFVFGTGISTTVRELLEISAKTAGYEPRFEGFGINEVCLDNQSKKILAISDLKFFRESDEINFVGDSTLLASKINWRPKKSIEKVIEEMTIKDLERVSHKI